MTDRFPQEEPLMRRLCEVLLQGDEDVAWFQGSLLLWLALGLDS